jgi:protein-S-isoprenylcysteine O-methyltransferase Ste14
MFFLSAGTILYWEAWIYLAIIFIPMGYVVRYFLHHDPELLERRMKMKERVTTQKLIVKFGLIVFLAAYLLPGFDKRFGWSDVPIILVVIADLLVLSGYLLIIRVFQENRYASRIIEVEQNQKVISTGPYAIIRHPMYSGVLLMYIFSPLALGSYWAAIPTLFIIIIIIARILNEEKILKEQLIGYREYTQKVRYRLIPGIW